MMGPLTEGDRNWVRREPPCPVATQLLDALEAAEKRLDNLFHVVRAQEAWMKHLSRCNKAVGDSGDRMTDSSPIYASCGYRGPLKQCGTGKRLWTECQAAKKEAGL